MISSKAHVDCIHSEIYCLNAADMAATHEGLVADPFNTNVPMPLKVAARIADLLSKENELPDFERLPWFAGQLLIPTKYWSF